MTLPQALRTLVHRVIVPVTSAGSMAALALILVLNCLEIVGRTFFDVSFSWIYEVNLLLAAWVYFLGIVPVYGRKGDITVVGLQNLLPRVLQLLLVRLVTLCSLISFGVLAWYSVELIKLQLPTRMPGLGLSSASFTIPLLIGSVALTLVMISQLLDELLHPDSAVERT